MIDSHLGAPSPSNDHFQWMGSRSVIPSPNHFSPIGYSHHAGMPSPNPYIQGFAAQFDQSPYLQYNHHGGRKGREWRKRKERRDKNEENRDEESDDEESDDEESDEESDEASDEDSKKKKKGGHGKKKGGKGKGKGGKGKKKGKKARETETL